MIKQKITPEEAAKVQELLAPVEIPDEIRARIPKDYGRSGGKSWEDVALEAIRGKKND